MTGPAAEADADVIRDALALVRAALDGDNAAVGTVAVNLAEPEVTAGFLAAWVAGLMRARGTGRDVLDAWQAEAGLR